MNENTDKISFGQFFLILEELDKSLKTVIGMPPKIKEEYSQEISEESKGPQKIIISPDVKVVEFLK